VIHTVQTPTQLTRLEKIRRPNRRNATKGCIEA
jgi:hypothetical protein